MNLLKASKDWGKHLIPALIQAVRMNPTLPWLNAFNRKPTNSCCLTTQRKKGQAGSRNGWNPESCQTTRPSEVLRWDQKLSLDVLHLYSKQLKQVGSQNYGRQYELERLLQEMVLYLHPKTLQQGLQAHPSYPQVEHLIHLGSSCSGTSDPGPGFLTPDISNFSPIEPKEHPHE